VLREVRAMAKTKSGRPRSSKEWLAKLPQFEPDYSIPYHHIDFDNGSRTIFPPEREQRIKSALANFIEAHVRSVDCVKRSAGWPLRRTEIKKQYADRALRHGRSPPEGENYDVKHAWQSVGYGMVPQLARVAHANGVPVLSSGGFDSVTEKYVFAVEIADDGRPTEVLHIGDHDPSGAHMFIALAEDVEAFARELGGSVSFTRLAVTPEQIADLTLETQVKKVTDNRAFGSRTARTCQAEAIAPDMLARFVRDAIESRIDHKALRRVLAREKRVQTELIEKLKAAA
jgi:hypothetical protein